MQPKPKIAIVGCGAHAQIAHIPIFKKNKDCELVALCDPDVRKIDQLGSKYTIPKKYQDFEAVLEDESIDSLVISTPNYLHAPMAISAMKYGKNILCEFPMATNLNDAKEMAQCAKKTKRKLCLTMNNRFRPDVQTLNDFISTGELGDIYYLKTGWLIGSREWILSPWRMDWLKSGGGAFLCLATTILDIAFLFLKNKTPTTIFGSMHKKESETDVEDTAMCIVNFSDETLLTVEVGWSLIFEKDFLYCNVFGKRGAALLNPLKIQKELHNELFNVTPSIAPRNIYKTIYEQQCNAFLDYIQKGKMPPVTIEEGLLIASITDAFYESAKSHQLVPIPAF
ncbi:hypothetical protein A2Y85_08260 [candidate division WOR-3 bacterium RBG_13_43_14]|uniref:Gfo/Idh/MocA-like oxidoreductase N-terminal domain-containing protein n=1 Tax=candidate division WOR-3 bacterium RBG_13_43_14 TaxID=1802590 RepID=A0A1F4U1B3_UNCW3|nr:MAG: hypothetical protein A2Y85_08260 [candidate division WOR-3 bacterium RBG_13_43_14]